MNKSSPWFKLNPKTVSIYSVVFYAIFISYFWTQKEQVECITSSFCLSSKEDIWIFPFLNLSMVWAIMFASWFGFKLAEVLMKSSNKKAMFTMVLVMVLAIGIMAYLKFIPNNEKLDYFHIPLIIAGFGALGYIMIRRMR